MTSTLSNKGKIEDLDLDVIKDALKSPGKSDKVIEKIELTPADYQFIKDNIDPVEIDAPPYWGIPVIVRYDIKKSRIFYKRTLPFCMRCGVSKKKGYWEMGCSSWGIYHKRHVWNNSKEIEKAKKKLGVVGL